MQVAIVKLSSLGDIVQALPVAAYLKGRGATVTWIVEEQFSTLVEGCSFVDKVIRLPIKAWKQKAPGLKEFREEMRSLRESSFDLLFDLQGNCKSAVITSLVKAKEKVGFGRGTIAEWPALFACHFHFDPETGGNIRDDYFRVVQGYFGDMESYDPPAILLHLREEERAKKFFTTQSLKVTVAAGSQWASKELRYETLLALIQKLDKILPIEWLFTSGTEREKGYADTLQQSVKMGKKLHLAPLPFLQHVMYSGHALLAVDSLPLHLAGLAGIPTFSFFGPSLASKYEPLKGKSIQGACPYGIAFPKRCPKLRSCSTSACIKDLDVDQLYPDVMHFLQNLAQLPALNGSAAGLSEVLN